ncbi:MAG TPA: ABC transporter substrate-binding protein [Candidatus Binatia bacterium]|jgi:putative ABC transport system substrate-binding protein
MRKNVFCRTVFAVLATVLLTTVLFAEAQQTAKIPRIGLLYSVSASSGAPRNEAFRQGLRELGYVEGSNILVEYRYADSKLDRLPALAAELVRLKVDVIVTSGPGPTRFAKAATATIPIVMSRDTDPVGNGFVASLARPGGNITGLSSLAPEISGKHVELLKEIIPRLSRLAVLGTSTTPGHGQLLKEIEIAAGAFGVTPQYLDVLRANDLESAFHAAGNGRADAILVLGSGIYASRRKQVVDLTVKYRLPAIYRSREYMEEGGLITYGVNPFDLDRRAAAYVDKILKGAKPADLPVEQPTKFEFVINLKAAKQIGVTIPPNVLVRAERVIK